MFWQGGSRGRLPRAPRMACGSHWRVEGARGRVLAARVSRQGAGGEDEQRWR